MCGGNLKKFSDPLNILNDRGKQLSADPLKIDKKSWEQKPTVAPTGSGYSASSQTAMDPFSGRSGASQVAGLGIPKS